MTYVSTEPFPECLEKFLVSAWPSEDRFEDWDSYLIPFSAEGSVFNALLSLAMPGLLRSTEKMAQFTGTRSDDPDNM